MDYMEIYRLCNMDVSKIGKEDLGKRIVTKLKDCENEIECIEDGMNSLFAKLCELGLEKEWM